MLAQLDWHVRVHESKMFGAKSRRVVRAGEIRNIVARSCFCLQRLAVLLRNGFIRVVKARDSGDIAGDVIGYSRSHALVSSARSIRVPR